jgi:undecaprenyl diphosphate synthase
MIMDGNKRWADLNKATLRKGYQKGLNKLREIVAICLEQEIKYLTVYALSAENMKRVSVSTIFDIIIKQSNKIIKEFSFNQNVRVAIIGEREKIPKIINNEFLKIEKLTKNNKKLKLNIAFNYGTNVEFLKIVKQIVSLYGNKEKKITQSLLRKHMYLYGSPDPDLLIRTGGFNRLSNFILLNIGYTEFFFTKTLWPDLSKIELLKIFDKFYKIERKYGL